MSDTDLIERMEERMAIMTYDGGLTRSEAEKRCYAALVAWCGRVGRTVPVDTAKPKS